jgi:hypothetical protein
LVSWGIVSVFRNTRGLADLRLDVGDWEVCPDTEILVGSVIDHSQHLRMRTVNETAVSVDYREFCVRANKKLTR